jgi:hypothetical protein
MPWKIVENHPDCPTSKPYAVVKADDGEREGCHASRAAAEEQLKALYANDENADSAAAASNEFDVILAIEGERTKDGREIAAEALYWRELPLPLMLQRTNAGHEGAPIAGRIEKIWREGNEIRGQGRYDNSEDGREAARLVNDQIIRWVSIDMETPDEWELREEGNCSEDALLLMPESDCVQVRHVLKARIMGATMVAFPAFPGAVIVPAGAVIPDPTDNGRAAVASSFHSGGPVSTTTATIPISVTTDVTVTPLDLAKQITDRLAESVAELKEDHSMEASLTAHALGFPAEPPADWFTDPGLTEPTPITITSEGRIYGHAALWDTCHIGRAGVCTTPPNSKTSYAYFRTGAVKCPDGCEIATGTITLNTGHASLDLDPNAAAAHYDHTGSAVADVASGEDEHGIWFSGALRPAVTDEQLRILRGSRISGDWRPIGGSLELVAMLAVNVPGFPIVRPLAASGARAHVKDGQQTALVAAAGPIPEHPLLRRLAELEQRLAAVEAVAEPLRPAAAASIRSKITRV